MVRVQVMWCSEGGVMEGHRIWGVDRGSGHRTLRRLVKKIDVRVYRFQYSTFAGAEQFQDFKISRQFNIQALHQHFL